MVNPLNQTSAAFFRIRLIRLSKAVLKVELVSESAELYQDSSTLVSCRPSSKDFVIVWILHAVYIWDSMLGGTCSACVEILCWVVCYIFWILGYN